MQRRALVTGAASGIGRAIAGRLEGDGHKVLAVDLHPDPDGPGEPFEADLTTREGNRAAVEAAVDRFGGLDGGAAFLRVGRRSEEHTSELQSRSTISYAVFCLDRKSVV